MQDVCEAERRPEDEEMLAQVRVAPVSSGRRNATIAGSSRLPCKPGS